jgi:hypothetical protein
MNLKIFISFVLLLAAFCAAVLPALAGETDPLKPWNQGNEIGWPVDDFGSQRLQWDCSQADLDKLRKTEAQMVEQGSFADASLVRQQRLELTHKDVFLRNRECQNLRRWEDNYVNALAQQSAGSKSFKTTAHMAASAFLAGKYGEAAKFLSRAKTQPATDTDTGALLLCGVLSERLKRTEDRGVFLALAKKAAIRDLANQQPTQDEINRLTYQQEQILVYCREGNFNRSDVVQLAAQCSLFQQFKLSRQLCTLCIADSASNAECREPANVMVNEYTNPFFHHNRDIDPKVNLLAAIISGGAF